MLRTVLLRLAILPLLLVSAALSRAAVTVTEVTSSGGGAPYEVAYTLNTVATSGQIKILDASNATVQTLTLSARDLGEGVHFVAWDGKTSGGAAAPAGAYTARVEVTGAPVAAGSGQILWGPNVIATGTNYPSWHGGITVNKNAGSPYYGRIYIADYANDRVVGYNNDGHVALVVNTLDQPINDFSSGTRGVSVAQDDRLYVYHEMNPSPTRAFVSVKQDGTDYRAEMDTDVIVRQMVVTGSGANRRFYFTAGYSVYVQKPGESVATVIIDNPADASTPGGTADGLVVLDSNNDPSGHANRVTIYVRTNAGTGVGATTVSGWEANSADPSSGIFNKSWTSPVNLGTGFTGYGLDRGPDGNLWTTLSDANTTVRGYVKLKSTDGTELDRITGAAITEKPRSNAVDTNGNVVGILIPDSINSTRGRDIAEYAPASATDTTDAVSVPVTVTGTTLPAVTITAGPTVNANSTSAKITWTTNAAASTEVFYGPSATSLPNRIAIPDQSITHSATISGLVVETQYFYQVRSAAPGKAAAMSPVLSFLTKNPAPALTNVQATTTTTSAKVTWTTDKLTDSVVIYGTTPDALTLSVAGNTNTNDHVVNISGLTPGTTYYFQAQSGSATIATGTANGFFATLNAQGTKTRTFTAFGDFKFGLLDDILLKGGDLTLNTKAAPSGVDDSAVPDLPLPRHNAAVTAYGGYLYVFGGRGASVSSTVFYAPVLDDGTVGAWQETTPMTDERYYTAHAAFGYNGYLYVAGGALLQSDNTLVFLGSTLMARQNPLDGSLGPWQVAGSFPDTVLRAWGAAGVWKGKAYYVGGQSDTAATNADTFIADIKPDGTLGAWTQVTDFNKSLPTPTRQQGFAIHNGRLYDWGGSANDTDLNTDKTVNVLTASGDLQDWAFGQLAQGRTGMASALLHGNAVMVGGSDMTADTTAISFAPVEADGTLGEFTDSAAAYPSALRDLDAAAWQGRLYVIGGRTTPDNDARIDATGQQTTAAVTFADSATFVANGHYESTVVDLGQMEPLHAMSVSATGTGVTLSVRTAGADGIFGAWQTQSGLSPTFPQGTQARYIQFALDLTGGASAPVVSSVAFTYGVPTSVISPEDARRALSIAGGLTAATAEDMARLNVAGDANITMLDAVTLLRGAFGL